MVFDEEDYCQCTECLSVYTVPSEFGLWDVCINCNKRLEGSFEYYPRFLQDDSIDLFVKLFEPDHEQ